MINKNIIIFLDTSCKKKYMINSKIKSEENIEINNKIFKIKKINISINSYNFNKNNEELKIKKRIEKFKKKYIKK